MGSQQSTAVAPEALSDVAPHTATAMSPLLKLCLQPERYYPIYESLMSHLETSDIVRLGRLSKELSNTYQDALKTQWSINALLKRFFTDPVQFRNVQAATGALITKHVAFGFFERRIIWSSEEGVDLAMCIVVEKRHNAEAIEDFIKGEGYLKADESEALEERSIVRISSFTKCKSTSGDRRVEIIVEHCETIPEHGFASALKCSTMGNVISWNKAYCLFPVALKTNVTYLMAQMPEETDNGHKEFCREILDFSDGHTLRSAAWVKQLVAGSKEYCELGPIRQLGDRFSWIIDLNIQGIQPPKQGLAPLDFATLNFQVPMDRADHFRPGVAPYLKTNSWVAKAVTLRHRYLLPEPPHQEGLYPQGYRWDLTPENSKVRVRHHYLMQALEEASLLQFKMLDPADRPASFEAVAAKTEDISSDVVFTAPHWWSYHDEAVLSYLRYLRKHIETQSSSSRGILHSESDNLL